MKILKYQKNEDLIPVLETISQEEYYPDDFRIERNYNYAHRKKVKVEKMN